MKKFKIISIFWKSYSECNEAALNSLSQDMNRIAMAEKPYNMRDRKSNASQAPPASRRTRMPKAHSEYDFQKILIKIILNKIQFNYHVIFLFFKFFKVFVALFKKIRFLIKNPYQYNNLHLGPLL